VEVPKGAQCFMGVYFPNDGSGENTEFVYLIDGTVGGFFSICNLVPVQTNLEYQIIAYSGVPSDDSCTGTCLGDAANLIPTDNDLKNDIWKINITNFELC
ncbi:23368_t:CDS:1, partial [Gigaspora margarita]